MPTSGRGSRPASRESSTNKYFSRRSVLAATGTVGAASLAGCLSGFGGGDSGTLTVGFAEPLSGSIGNLGNEVIRGFKLRVDEELDGEIGGMEVEYAQQDTAGDPSTGVSAARKLLQEEQVDVLVGPVSSAVALAMVSPFKQAAQSRDAIWLNASAANYKITSEHCLKYQFRIARNTWHAGAPMAPYVYENVSDNVALAFLDYAGGEQTVNFFQQRFEELGGTIAGRFPVGFDVSDFSSYLQQIEDSGADAVFGMFIGGNAVNFVKDYAQFGLDENIQLTGIGDMVSERLVQSQQDAAQGAITHSFYTSSDDISRNQEFVESYTSAYPDQGQPDSYSCGGYDSALAIEKGIEEAGGMDADGIAQTLAGSELDSPRGFFQFHPDTHDPITEMDIRRVVEQDGGFGNEVIDKIEKAEPPTWGCTIEE
ncbi:ABC transporter substrate-binding protein [Haloarchaeobius sp. HRN-SO-5]|uniref:ABC transporter substrate-binding protein n=1 Tax=Haloarchaeobius sp. HRN-SO-5 TaxID=3446118 RepID=UPI003EC13FCB